MRRRELESKIMKLERDLSHVIAGGNGISPLLEYAKGEGTGYKAYAKAKETIEALIVKAKEELAALPGPSKFEQIKDQCEMEYGGEIPYMDALDAYIKALEACRPWVIRKKSNGALWVCGNKYAAFLLEVEAKSYYDAIESFRHGEWEVVQWEGNQ